jgi:hypothetical protein
MVERMARFMGSTQAPITANIIHIPGTIITMDARIMAIIVGRLTIGTIIGIGGTVGTGTVTTGSMIGTETLAY